MASKNFRRLLCAAALALLAAAARSQEAAAPAELKQLPARASRHADSEMLLAAARAGDRLVAVGDHGTIVLSDDGGRTFRQARSVPTRVTLNSVSFADRENGWAAGHWGTSLRTADGGETWTLQRTDTSVDRPLFAIHALDATHVVAAGLWSLVVVSDDAGARWEEVRLPAPPDGGRADRNLFGAFSEGNTLYLVAERGLVLRSADSGRTWSYGATGYRGSLWTGVALKDGILLVGGLRGTIYRSADAGRTWHAVDSPTRSSITGFAETSEGIVAVGLDGVVLVSRDRGLTFSAGQRDDHTALTAVVANPLGKPVAFSKAGVVPDLQLPPAAR